MLGALNRNEEAIAVYDEVLLGGNQTVKCQLQNRGMDFRNVAKHTDVAEKLGA